MDHKRPEELMGSALAEAVSSGKVEVVKKIGIDPTRDDPSHLLAQCWLCDQPSLVQMLLDAGADPNRGEGENQPMRCLMRGSSIRICCREHRSSPAMPLFAQLEQIDQIRHDTANANVIRDQRLHERGHSNFRPKFADDVFRKNPNSMSQFPKMFDAKTTKQFGLVFSKCSDVRIVCEAREKGPAVTISGQDLHGNKHVVAAEIDPAWALDASYTGQFVVAVVDNLRLALKGAGLGKGFKLKRPEDFLKRTFVHAALMPIIDKFAN